MSTDAEPRQLEPSNPVLSFFFEGMVFYACAQYPTPASIELMTTLQDRDARCGKSLRTSLGCEIHAFHSRPSSRGRSTPYCRINAMTDTMDRFMRLAIVAFVARTALTFPFWSSGLAKLFSFQSGVDEMARVGLAPAAFFNLATIIVQLGASLLIIANRFVWLGGGALGVFTGLTVILVHRFWAMSEEPFRTIAFHTATEHVGIIGGLIAVSILGGRVSRTETA
jgi:transmembrane protein